MKVIFGVIIPLLLAFFLPRAIFQEIKPFISEWFLWCTIILIILMLLFIVWYNIDQIITEYNIK